MTVFSNPLITVMMPSYNAAKTLPWALSSLMIQSYENWECVLVDDGSTDSTQEIVKAFEDNRIRYFRLDRNRGRGYARQFALDKASGHYLAFLDADDWLYPLKLEAQVTLMENCPGLVLVTSRMADVDYSNTLLAIRGVSRTFDRVLKGPDKIWDLKINFPACMLKMTDARRAGFDITLKLCEDRDFLLKILPGSQYLFLSEVHYAYRFVPESRINEPDLDLEVYKNNKRIYEKYNNTYPFLSRRLALELYLRNKLTPLRNKLIEFRGNAAFLPTDLSQKFENARSAVGSFVEKRFGGSTNSSFAQI